MNALLLGVDGFGPVYGWPMFFAVMALVLIGGGVLGLVGRAADNRKRAGNDS